MYSDQWLGIKFSNKTYRVRSSLKQFCFFLFCFWQFYCLFWQFHSLFLVCELKCCPWRKKVYLLLSKWTCAPWNVFYDIHHDSTWRTCGYVTRIPENVANLWVEIYKIAQIVTALANHPMCSCCRCNSSLTLKSRETSWILLLITVECTFSFATAYFRQWCRIFDRLLIVPRCRLELENTTLRSRDRPFGELIAGIVLATFVLYLTVISTLGACDRPHPVRNFSWFQEWPSRWMALSKRASAIAGFGPPGVWDRHRWPEIFGMHHLGCSQSLV